MNLPQEWAELYAYDLEQQRWRDRGELAIRVEMEKRLKAYFIRRADAKELDRIAGTLSKRPRLVQSTPTGALNPLNRRNAEAVAQGRPRIREINQQRRESLDAIEDMRTWRHPGQR